MAVERVVGDGEVEVEVGVVDVESVVDGVEAESVVVDGVGCKTHHCKTFGTHLLQ